MITRLVITKKFVRTVLALLVISVALLGVTASCTEGGMSQEGGDSEPYWR